MLADLVAPRHPLDGSGSISFAEQPKPVMAGAPGQWVLRYTAGSEGLLPGALVFLQAAPFWGWSTPQINDENRAGWTLISVEGETPWTAQTVDQQLLAVELEDGLLAGQSVVFSYHGRADRYAESNSRFWIAVDGDGDGIRALVKKGDRLMVEVSSRPATQLHLVVPSTARPHEEVILHASALDGAGNLDESFAGEVSLKLPEGMELIQKEPRERGVHRFIIRCEEQGLHRIQATSSLGEFSANPILVRESAPPILWADLQVHTGLSDGTGSLADVYHYAKEVAGLDAICITDHDHWGMDFLDQSPQVWDQILQEADDWNDPGTFVAFPGFEWTSWLWGHRHVLFGSREDAVLLSSVNPETDTPQELWEALKGSDAMTIAHHSAGGPVAIDWRIPPDPFFEPVTEVISVHGSSEAKDSPGLIRGAVSGNFVRDALRRNYPLGLIGSTDGHDGHPGLSQFAGGQGGLAAVLTEDRTRSGILAALRNRSCYATNGERILLWFEVDGGGMGSTLSAGEGKHKVMCRVAGTGPIRSVEVITQDGVVMTFYGTGSSVLFREFELERMADKGFVYVRVLQEDGGMAWSSPVFAPK